jgi:hypothetical protein
VIAPGLHLAFKNRSRVSLSGLTIVGEDATRGIWVCGAGAFVALKALAFDLRGENKDAYDLFYVLRNYGAGLEDVAACLPQRQWRGSPPRCRASDGGAGRFDPSGRRRFRSRFPPTAGLNGVDGSRGAEQIEKVRDRLDQRPARKLPGAARDGRRYRSCRATCPAW